MENLLENNIFLMGLLLGSGLFVLMINFVLNRQRSYMFFALYTFSMCLSIASLNTEINVMFFIFFWLAIASLLLFFTDFLHVPNRSAIWVVIIIELVISLYAISLDATQTYMMFLSFMMFISALMVCAIIAIFAMKRKQESATLLFYTIVAIFIVNMGFLSESFFTLAINISSIALILSIMYVIINDIRKQQVVIKELKIRTMQSENMMLKKVIQPHFLVNTLTIISEWIEREPKKALAQIQLLSKEFRSITKLSGKDLIPIHDELKLCQIHLDMFNAKKTSTHGLECIGIDDTDTVPPMMFHTLIENGLTHSTQEQSNFTITAKYTEKSKTYLITSTIDEIKDANQDGLGLSYIKSRLESSYPHRWNLSSHHENNMWITEIRIDL